MTVSLNRRRATTLVLVVWMVLGLSAGCSRSAPTPQVSRVSTPTQKPPPTAAPTPVAVGRPTALVLTWWAPEFLSAQAPQPAGPLLAQQLAAFSMSQSGRVRVETVRKARYGKGGLLDALRTAHPVARDTLPDLIALDVAELGKAVESGLVQPLDGLIEPGVTEKLYPFASEAGQFGGRLYGVQYLADVDHAAYLPAHVAEPPHNWDELMSRRIAYLFPLAPPRATGSQAAARPVENLSHAVLGQYLSAGATLGPDRRLLIEPQALLRLLLFYQDAMKTGALPPVANDLTDGEGVWNIFSQGQVPYAYVSARQYMNRGELTAGFAPPLGYQDGATSVAGGWVLAVVTAEPERQRAAAQLMGWLLKADNAGAWAGRAGWLPTSAEGLKMLGAGSYWAFLDGQLAQARALPTGTDYATTAARIETAIQAVVSGQSDAQAAVDAALNGQ